MRPLSYWYDGEAALYFVYVLAGESEKQGLTDEQTVLSARIYIRV